MNIHLRNRFTVHICTTLILKLFHGFFGWLPQTAPSHKHFSHNVCLLKHSQPGNAERTGIQSKHITYGNICNKSQRNASEECPQMEGFPWRKQWSGQRQKKKNSMNCLFFRMCLRWMQGMNIRSFLLVPTAALVYYGDVQRTNSKISSWPHSNIVLFVVPEGFQLIFICGFGQRNVLVNLPSPISVCKLKASWGFINSLIHQSFTSEESSVFSVPLSPFISAELLVGSLSNLHTLQSRGPVETAGPTMRIDN